MTLQGQMDTHGIMSTRNGGAGLEGANGHSKFPDVLYQHPTLRRLNRY